MFQRILVAVENPESRALAPLKKAAQLAAATGAELELYHDLASPVFVEELKPGRGGLAAAKQAGESAALRGLERLAAPLRKAGLQVSTHATWDYPPHEAIVRRAASTNADLVVIAPRHKHSFAKLLGYNDWELLRECPVPLLLVKSDKAWRRGAVLAAIDPTHAFAKPHGLDDIILQQARDLAAALHCKPHVVHSFQVLPGMLQAAAAEDAKLTEVARREARRNAGALLRKSLADSGIGPRQQHLLEAHPIDAIGNSVRKLRPNVLVMGSVSRSGLKRLFIGNTAERILDEVACDVLVVRPAGFKNRVPRRSRGVQLLSATALAQPPML